MRTERDWQWQKTFDYSVKRGADDQEQYRCEFFNPDTCRFEIHGFFERLVDAHTHKGLGTRRLEKPDRPLGSDGLKEYELTEDTIVKCGHKDGLIKASKIKPVKVIGIIEALCGWEKSNK